MICPPEGPAMPLAPSLKLHFQQSQHNADNVLFVIRLGQCDEKSNHV